MPQASFRCRRALAAAALSLGCIVAAPARAAPLFDEIPGALGQQQCPNGAGCWTTYARLDDLDGDGDLDVVFANAYGYYDQIGQPQPLKVYLNNGNATFTDASDLAVGGYAGWVRQVAVGDVDGDGDLDIYVANAWGDPDAFFLNDGSATFTDEAATRLPGVASAAGAARFGDVDGDGDLDLLVTDGWAASAPDVAHLYLNDGAGVFAPAPAGALPTTRSGDQPIDIDFFDLDGDLDLDVLIDMHTGRSSLWQNDGAGVFTDLTPQGMPPQAGLHNNPAACDIDGDGDLDLWFDNAAQSYTEQLLLNQGGELIDQSVVLINGNQTSVNDGAVACADVDTDGDLDAVILSLSGDERVLINSGSGTFAPSPDAFVPLSDATLAVDFGDMDGDGRIDLVTGQAEMGSMLNRVYLANSLVPPDTRPPRLRAVEAIAGAAPGDAPAVRFAVVDGAVTDGGPRLSRAFVRVSTPDSMQEVPARFVGGDLFRALLPAQPPDTEVSYAACAVDAEGNEACAEPRSYVVGPDPAGAGGGGQGGGGDGGNGGGGGAAATPAGDDAGCGCAVPGRGRSGGLAALALAGLVMAAARRRPRRPRAATGRPRARRSPAP